jgi:putative flippase GtrA
MKVMVSLASVSCFGVPVHGSAGRSCGRYNMLTSIVTVVVAIFVWAFALAFVVGFIFSLFEMPPERVTTPPERDHDSR